MNFSTSSKTTNGPTVILHLEGAKAESSLLGKNRTELLNTFISKKAFTGEKSQTVHTHLTNGNVQKLMLFGLGKEKELSDTEARKFGGQVIKAAAGFAEKNINIVIPKALLKYIQAFSEGLVMGNFNPAIHKTGEETQKKEDKRIKKIELIASNWTRDLGSKVKDAKLIGQVINYTRNIVNCGPKQMSISQLVKEVRATAKENGYKLTDLDKKKLEKLKMGGILAVNRGSSEPAHMMILEHNAKLKEAPIVICGKGIIFDTGGVSLKPSTHMHEMQLDMGGAAAVLGTFKLLKKLGVKRRVVGIMPITDNAIGSNAYRPSEIVTTYSGKTVEVMNTDAEGRMILCDALYYGATKYKPKYLLDMATLTGACMVALGYRNAGLFGNDQKLMDRLKKSAETSDEGLCQLPITETDEKAMKGKIADLTNLDMAGRYAGASRAAAFLKNFVADSKWAHIDLAGPAYTKEPKAYEVSMGTGFGVRLMIDFVQNN